MRALALMPGKTGSDDARTRQSRESGNLLSLAAPPKKIPAFAGMTGGRLFAMIVGMSLIVLPAAGPAFADECTGGAAGTVSVMATSLDFAEYDARTAGADVNTFTVTASCSGGGGGAVLPPLQLALSTGDGSYAQRRMEKGADTLDYQVFLNAGLTQIWGDGSGATAIASTGGGTASQNFAGYGAISPGQWVSAGSYADSLTVTVSY
jgi:spore coat protein U-like protein